MFSVWTNITPGGNARALLSDTSLLRRCGRKLPLTLTINLFPVSITGTRFSLSKLDFKLYFIYSFRGSPVRCLRLKNTNPEMFPSFFSKQYFLIANIIYLERSRSFFGIINSYPTKFRRLRFRLMILYTSVTPKQYNKRKIQNWNAWPVYS